MTAKEMAAACRNNQDRFLKIATLADTAAMQADFLYEAQLFGNMAELLEDYIYDGGRHIDFLFKCFEAREKEYLAALLPKPFAASEAEAQTEKPK